MSQKQTPRQHLLRNQRGSVIIMIALSLVALFSFAVIAIDGAILMTTKNQLQSAADAAALAGASGLKFGETEARRRAGLFAEYNYAVQDTLQPVVIDELSDNDVWFPSENRIKVRTHRTAATGDALRTYFLRILDLAAGMSPTSANRVDITAEAAAELVDNCAATCVKPWAIPDRWDDANLDGHYTAGEYYDPVATGYLAPNDVGTQLAVHAAQGDEIVPGHYFSIDLPPLGGPVDPLTGGDWYREWIATCAPYVVAPGDSCQLEPGQMVGPTIQGIVALINQDPGAYWDPATENVMGSAFGQSPRIALVPFFDPRFGPTPGRNYVKITKIGAFFLESVGPGSQVQARFIQVTAPGLPCEENTGSSFVLGLHLVE